MGCSCQLQVELKPEFQAQAEAVFRDADLEPEEGLIEKTAALITYNFEQIHSSAPDDIRSDLVNAGVQCKVTTHYSDTEYAPELSLLEPQEENGPIVEVTMNEIEAAANAERVIYYDK